jgi:NTP pyrophosphatase (non-canonical NTP hydrolase)
MGALSDIIKEYYEKRGLVWPNFDNAMKFVATEIGEVYEIDLDRNTWVRNNPEDKPKFNKDDLAKELGDVLMMVMVAGIVEGVDPLDALLGKIYDKTGILFQVSKSEARLYPVCSGIEHSVDRTTWVTMYNNKK